MSDSVGNKAESLAGDIQSNVYTLLKDHGQGKTARGAENALVKDAYQLGYSAWDSGTTEGKAVKQIQTDVQSDLNKLEKNGTLPQITIDHNGMLIDCRTKTANGGPSGEVGVDEGIANAKTPSVWYVENSSVGSNGTKAPNSNDNSKGTNGSNGKTRTTKDLDAFDSNVQKNLIEQGDQMSDQGLAMSLSRDLVYNPGLQSLNTALGMELSRATTSGQLDTDLKQGIAALGIIAGCPADGSTATAAASEIEELKAGQSILSVNGTIDQAVSKATTSEQITRAVDQGMSTLSNIAKNSKKPDVTTLANAANDQLQTTESLSASQLQVTGQFADALDSGNLTEFQKIMGSFKNDPGELAQLVNDNSISEELDAEASSADKYTASAFYYEYNKKGALDGMDVVVQQQNDLSWARTYTTEGKVLDN